MARWWVLMFVGLVFSGKLSAAVDLPEKYRAWIDQDVRFIVSDDDRKHFLALKTDGERDAFIEDFWRKLDPYPVTPANEFKDEYYSRLAYARDHFGLDSDKARVWVLLGKPNMISRCPQDYLGMQLYGDLNCWYYWGLHIRDFPSYLQLSFFRRWGVGPYVLYSPFMDNPEGRIVSRLPSAADRYWLKDHLDPESATRANIDLAERRATSMAPPEQEGIIQKLLLRGAEVVQTSVKTSVKTEVALKGEENLPLDAFFTTVQGADDQFELRMLIELQPQGITFEEIGKQYAARIDVIIRLLDEADRVITENSASLPMELTREQLDRSKSFPLRYIYKAPVLAGRYKADVIAVDVVSGKGGRVEMGVTVDEREAGRQSAFPGPAAGQDAFWFEAAELSDAERHSILGQQCLNAGKLEQAARELDRALHDNPLDQDVLVKLGRTRLELGQDREALEAVDSVLWYDRWNLDALIVSSVAQLRLHRVDDCRGTIDLVLHQYPGSVLAINHCANTYLELGEKERAEELFCRSLEIEPDQPEVKSAMEGLRTR